MKLIYVGMLFVSLILLAGVLFVIQSYEQKEKYEEALGPIILTSSEKDQVREIRKDTNVLIYIPEEKTLLGSTKKLSQDNYEIKEIVKSWINDDRSIKEFLGEAN